MATLEYEAVITCEAVADQMSCVRWINDGRSTHASFVTGSYGEASNVLAWWQLSIPGSIGEGDYQESHKRPKWLTESSIQGDITALEAGPTGTLLAATSEGLCCVVKMEEVLDEHRLQLSQWFQGSHTFDGEQNASCTGLSVYDSMVTTVGEDGRLYLYRSIHDTVPLREYQDANKSSYRCVKLLDSNNVLVGSSNHLLHCFDLRNGSDMPSFSLYTGEKEEELAGSSCAVCIRPMLGRDKFIFAGLESGTIMGWDLRNPNGVTQSMEGHSGAVTGMCFPVYSAGTMFSASDDGDIGQWHFDMQQWEGNRIAFQQLVKCQTRIMKQRHAIRSIDANATQLIAVGDGRMIFFIDSVSYYLAP
uniref:Putative nucleoporin nup43 n=1 Tax=Anopheles darlingi TaxID=43151 RepID=A0A2M4CUP6_ANODA